MKQRLSHVRRALKQADLDLYLVTHLPHVRYLCGFSGSNGMLLISERGAEFFTDGRYTEQAGSEVKGAKIVVPEDGNLVEGVAKSGLLGGRHPKVGIQPRFLNLAVFAQFEQRLEGALLVPHDEIVEPVAARKDASEIRLIEKAVRIVDTAFERILPVLRPGVRELDAAAELEYIMLKLGSEGTPFETICASGPRSALPHGRASTRKMKRGDFVTLDFGAQAGGYCSDITRTVVLGKASPRHRRIYDIVYRAQTAAVRQIRPGQSTRSVDNAARRIIKRAGYGKNFGHGTGHGVGLEVHQPPSLSPRVDSKLEIGMVVTIEPGVYIPGFGGVRIEDDVLVTRGGHRVLTRAPRHLIEL